MDDRRRERPYERYEDRYDTRNDNFRSRYDGGDAGGYAARSDYQDYGTRPEARNWQEVIAGALITAAGLYFISRGLEQRRERHNLPLPFSGGGDSDDEREGGIQVRESVTVDKPASELYDYWRDLSNLPIVMRHLKSVEEKGEGRSHWVAKGPMNTDVEWDAEITYDNEDRSIAWKSVENSQVPNEGSVRFTEAPGGRGTEVHVSLTYHPPLGPVGAAVAKLFGEEPSQQISEDLKRFKGRMETGEVATTEGQPQGNG